MQPPPAWLGELTEAQQAVVCARTVGIPRTRPQVVLSDGEATWLRDRPPPDTPRGSPALQPPSILERAAGEISEKVAHSPR
jgi:hypothetical protein